MISTNDIYYAGYLLTCGFYYQSSEKDTKGNIIFSFYAQTREEEIEAEYAFDEGLGNVNVRNYITSISLILDIVYKARIENS